MAAPAGCGFAHPRYQAVSTKLLLAIVEFESDDTRRPVGPRGVDQVLRGKPKCAIIRRIDLHGRIIAPTLRGRGLRTTAGNTRFF